MTVTETSKDLCASNRHPLKKLNTMLNYFEEAFFRRFTSPIKKKELRPILFQRKRGRASKVNM